MRNFVIGLIVGVAACVAVFYGMRFYQLQEFANAVAATQQVQSPAAPTPRPADWSVRSTKDKITDRVSWFMLDNSQEGQTLLMLGCNAGQMTTMFQSERFYPAASIDDNGSYYVVSYRFDGKPGVEMENWPGMAHYAKPKDMDGFLDQAANSKKLIIRIDSTTMSDAAREDTFDLTGFGIGLAELRSKCSASASAN